MGRRLHLKAGLVIEALRRELGHGPVPVQVQERNAAPPLAAADNALAEHARAQLQRHPRDRRRGYPTANRI